MNGTWGKTIAAVEERVGYICWVAKTGPFRRHDLVLERNAGCYSMVWTMTSGFLVTTTAFDTFLRISQPYVGHLVTI